MLAGPRRHTKTAAAGDRLEPRVLTANFVGATDHTSTSLIVVFLLVIGSFLATSLYARFASAEIASLSERLATNVNPSIEDLASIRGSVLEVELRLSQLVSAEEATPERVSAVEDSVSTLHATVLEYVALPLAPRERSVHEQIQRGWLRFAEEARYVRSHAVAGEMTQARQQMGAVESAGESLVAASMRAIEFNANHGRVLAAEIGESRHRTTLVAGGLTALSVLLGLMGAGLLYRQARRSRTLADERARALEERATELEQFAGRVAHDIRGPLGAASLAAGLLATREDNEGVRGIVARLDRSLRRASAITNDLLEFARAGARPDPGARTSPRNAVAEIRDDLEAEAAKHDIELIWDELPLILVACSHGVYLSLLGNLVRNAIKYMGRSSVRRIVVRVSDDGSAVRTEVADTGPGVPANQLGSLFEPYFRGSNTAGREGLGLGLPTVRKLAEGHGGKVGVSSEEGNGSTFWFTLPRAGSVTE